MQTTEIFPLKAKMQYFLFVKKRGSFIEHFENWKRTCYFLTFFMEHFENRKRTCYFLIFFTHLLLLTSSFVRSRS